MKTILQFADLLVWFNSSVEMDVEEALRTGLTSSPKYLPVWYRYDKQGSLYNDRCLKENPHYYLYEAEISLLRENIQVYVYLKTKVLHCPMLCRGLRKGL